MCYSANISLEILLVNHIGSLILYYTYDKILSTLFFFVGFMQFWDYIFWKFPKKSLFNYWATKIAMLNQHIIPIVFAISISFFQRKWLDPMNVINLIIYSIVALVYSIHAWYHIDYTKVIPRSYPGLFWKWNHFKGSYTLYGLFLYVIISLLFTYYPYPINIIFIACSIIIALYSYFNYKKESDFSKLWCSFTIYLPLFTIFIYIAKDILEHRIPPDIVI